jgi:hypothetical protein
MGSGSTILYRKPKKRCKSLCAWGLTRVEHPLPSSTVKARARRLLKSNGKRFPFLGPENLAASQSLA